MSTNLRLSESAAAALRAAARRAGRSQQDLLREAVDRFLGLHRDDSSRDRALAAGLVKPPTRFQDVAPSIRLAPGVTTLDMLGQGKRSVSILYVDTSALLKRVVVEAESSALRALLLDRDAAGDLLTTSSIAWLEVWRSLRRAAVTDVEATAAAALSGVAEFQLADAVLHRARRVGSDDLRSLDAIHLASAIAVGADFVVTYDMRLAESATSVGLGVLSPAVDRGQRPPA